MVKPVEYSTGFGVCGGGRPTQDRRLRKNGGFVDSMDTFELRGDYREPIEIERLIG